MREVEVSIGGRSYLVDLDAHNMYYAMEINRVVATGDEQQIVRTIHSLIIRAIGIEQFNSIPNRCVQETLERIIETLTKVNIYDAH